jgi:O-antigen/teichoic acid export membrane protein
VFPSILQALSRLFLHNIIFAIIAHLLIKPFWVFYVDQHMQIIAGHERFGHYAALLNLCIIFNYLLDLGLTHYYNVTAAAVHEKTKSLYLPLIKIKFVLFLPYLLIVVLAAQFFSISVSPLLFYVLLLQFFISLLAFTRAGIASLQYYKLDTILSILDKLLLISFLALGGAFFVFQGRLENYVLAQVIAYAVVNSIGLFFIFNKGYNGGKISLREIIKDAAPFAIIVFFMAIYSRIDIVLLQKLHPKGDFQAGVYAYCYRFLDIANMIGFLFAGLLLSLFSRFKGDLSKIHQLLHYSAYVLIPASVILSCICYHFGGTILNWAGPYADPLHIHTFRNVMLGFPALCMMHIYCTWLTSSLRLSYLIWITLGVALLSYLGISLILPQGDAADIALWSSLVFYVAGIGYVVKSYMADQEIHSMPFIYLVGISILIVIMNMILTYLNIGIILTLALNILVYFIILSVYYSYHRLQIKQYL